MYLFYLYLIYYLNFFIIFYFEKFISFYFLNFYFLFFYFLFFFCFSKKNTALKNKREGSGAPPEGNKLATQYADASLVPSGSGNLKIAVKLPEGENIDEWLAVNSKIIYFILF